MCTLISLCSWLRIMCVYLVSGIGGFLLSGIFDPTKVSVGGSGSLFGLFGILILEVMQGWKWVRRPCVELIKILIMVIFLLGMWVPPGISVLVSCTETAKPCSQATPPGPGLGYEARNRGLGTRSKYSSVHETFSPSQLAIIGETCSELLLSL